ncbi:MAG: extracellular solute-binding protein [Ancalomicrobiaceae bacterium]|nr:extracellular solute-binding protein [Ancalomicrobiaceae bacterium]
MRARPDGLTPTRRQILKAAAAVPFAAPFAGIAAFAEDSERYGLSYFGDLKYPADFAHFDYVNPDAPTGGRLIRTAAFGAFNQSLLTFDTLNSLVLKGQAPANELVIFDTLMARALDEPDAIYGLVAKSVRVLDGGRRYVFRLRPEARFHDGSPLTADDVVFSMRLLKDKGHPDIVESIKGLASAEVGSDGEVVVTFAAGVSRGMPLFVAGLPILSKAYYTAHDFEKSTMEPPLGSGPYRIGRFEAGSYIEYQRVPDYWGKDLPVNRGQGNFDIIRYEMYRNRTVSLEAFKAGQYLMREEFTARDWATQYNFPAVIDGRVKTFELPDGLPSGAQGWFLNMRRPQFADIRVREALGLAFDFEWTNKNLFYGSYTRTASFFENSDLKATGKPSAAELALLEPFRGRVPDEVFGEAWVPPVSDGSGHDRTLLRRASELLKAAGWVSDNGVLKNAKGEALTIEFLEDDPGLERIVQPYLLNLKLLGVSATVRTIDAAQYQSRLDDFDFDATSRRFSMSPTPDEGISVFWRSDFAKLQGSRNYAGIADPVIDALLKTMLSANSRVELEAAARALDRVLRSGRYWVPHWYKTSHNMAVWDVYGRPDKVPAYDNDAGINATWWIDRARAEKIGKGL